ncbi:MAG: hypothetical protein SOH99_12875 [Acidipropionibacterium acidipropionici]|jgi:uncharacterized membrane protein|uniref:SHOCT domain-containing protein n=1 Tax=Acidipropionibacterium acidipropionici TaxID=1748 RepID=A0AAC8YFV9_9ACTN|nr:hypothetical protein [Acidipropionibacterium acidipropionici]AMS05853.1 hypothetical protein AXH35_10780 [Acidipropionibacterium acidipropionici]AOZ47318.1 hypothetical protein A8L58_12220 [Acidipropionibacterium acidipropionici]AZP36576.1 SHOCT domain-containing protein [Acidipropionibacterium acidipropionici]QCV96363.1 SHOCT domain-containing protein [Acidipropionibacterium acidipropionici]
MDATGGYPGWSMWIVMIAGTAALWTLVFLTIRALYIDRDTHTSPTSARPGGSARSEEVDLLEQRLARGEITVEEYVHLRAQIEVLPGRRPDHRTVET